MEHEDDHKNRFDMGDRSYLRMALAHGNPNVVGHFPDGQEFGRYSSPQPSRFLAMCFNSCAFERSARS